MVTMKEIYASKRNIQNDGQQLVTKELQKLIDEAYKTHSVLYIDKGTYLTGPLFLHKLNLLGEKNDKCFVRKYNSFFCIYGNDILWIFKR